MKRSHCVPVEAAPHCNEDILGLYNRYVDWDMRAHRVGIAVRVRFDDMNASSSWELSDPRAVYVAWRPNEVPGVLAEVESTVRHAAHETVSRTHPIAYADCGHISYFLIAMIVHDTASCRRTVSMLFRIKVAGRSSRVAWM